MKKLLKKLGISEIITLTLYGVILTLFNSENLFENSEYIFIYFVVISFCSIWSMKKRNGISPVLFPFHILLSILLVGFAFGFAGTSGGAAALGVGIMSIILVFLLIQVIFSMIFTGKDVLNLLLIILVSAGLTFATLMFLSSGQIDGKGGL